MQDSAGKRHIFGRGAELGSVYMEDRKTDSYRVLLEGGEGEYVEKKSRFIATLRKCGSEEEAVRFVEEMKKKYWDARHNCHAFVIGSKGELTR